MYNGTVRIGRDDRFCVLAGYDCSRGCRPRSRNAACVQIGPLGIDVGHSGHACGIQAVDDHHVRRSPGSQRDIDAAIGVVGSSGRQSPSKCHVARRVHLRDGGKGLLGRSGSSDRGSGGGFCIGFRRFDSAFRLAYFLFGGFRLFDKGRDCLHGFRLDRLHCLHGFRLCRFHGCDSSALCAGYLVRGGFLRSPYSKNGISLLGLYDGNGFLFGRANRLFPVADRLRKI